MVGGVSGGSEVKLQGALDSPSDAEGQKAGSNDDGVEKVETGTSTIPHFPKTIHVPGSGPGAGVAEEYQLVGLGIRTVSFLSIQVYVVGIYIALSDVATLQESLIRKVDDVATTLVPNEKARLKQMLLDPEQGEEIWSELLRNKGIRTAVRISPTRNTDLAHMRDGFVRGVTGKTQTARSKGDLSYEDEAFGESLRGLKEVFQGGNRRKLGKGDTLLLVRDRKGVLDVWTEAETGREKLGRVEDERIGRLIWLHYLAGKSVASEAARNSVVDGVMEFVERPVGTVATQVT